MGRDRIEDASDEDWLSMYETNVMGALRMTRGLLPALEASGDGHVVMVGSIAGYEPYIGGGGYNAAKFAVRAMTKVLRMELLGRPIRVTEVDPGLVKTEFSVVRFRGDERAAEAVYEGITPLTAEDVAECIAFAVNAAEPRQHRHARRAGARSVGRGDRPSPLGRWRPVSAAAGGLDPQPLARLEHADRLRRAAPGRRAGCARGSPASPPPAPAGRMAPALGDQRVAAAARAPRARARRRRRRCARHRRRIRGAGCTATTRIGNSSSSASIGVLSVLLIATWTPLGPSASRAGALAAADRLVVDDVVVAERDVVHRALAERAAERAQDDVGDPRGGLDVAADDRRR